MRRAGGRGAHVLQLLGEGGGVRGEDGHDGLRVLALNRRRELIRHTLHSLHAI